MKDFIGNILTRHLGTGQTVNPRLPGRFEQPQQTAAAPMIELDRTRDPAAINSQSQQTISTEFRAAALETRAPIGIGRVTGNQHVAPAGDRPFAASEQIHVSAQQPLFRPDEALIQPDLQSAASHPDVLNAFDEPATGKKGAADARDSFAGSLNIDNTVSLTRNEAYNLYSNHSETQRELDAGPAPVPDSPGGANPGLALAPFLMAGETPRSTIKVSIGQIHVRGGVQAPASTAKPAQQQPRKPALSLEDYLKNRG